MGPETDDSQIPEASADGAAGPVGGERLAATRRERGISVRDIAKELHLDEPKVRAIEENRFEVLGAPVFAKGHMRKYAELVGVPIDDVLADYYQLNRSAGAPPVVGPPRKVHRELSIGPWIAGIFVILVVAIAAWWLINRQPAVDAVTFEPATLAPFESERRDDSAAAADDSDTPGDDSGTAESPENTQDSSIAGDQQVAAVEAPAEPAPDLQVTQEPSDVENVLAGDSVELILSFSGDCWTEVTDATGRRLYFGLGTDGRSVTLNGVEPLGLLLGNSSNVSIQVNGFDYRIPAANRRGNTARLTIYGQ